MIQPETAQSHRCRVQSKREQQQEIIGAIILAKVLSPQKNRINHAQAVNRNGEQKEMPICLITSKPVHENRVTANAYGASRESPMCKERANA
jgi:hypothetical protein